MTCETDNLEMEWSLWCCLSSAWSSRHWSQCCRLWSLCRDAQLILPVLLPLRLGHRCHQQGGDKCLFCLHCLQCLCDLLRRLSWSFSEICWRGWVRVDIPVGLQLLFGSSLFFWSSSLCPSRHHVFRSQIYIITDAWLNESSIRFGESAGFIGLHLQISWSFSSLFSGLW